MEIISKIPLTRPEMVINDNIIARDITKVTKTLKRRHPSDCTQTTHLNTKTDRYSNTHTRCDRRVRPRGSSDITHSTGSTGAVSYFNQLCTNTIVYTLSFLEPRDIENFGATCKEHKRISMYSVLWTSVTLQNAENVDLHTLCRLVRRTSPVIQPLSSLSVIRYTEMNEDICECAGDDLCRVCCASRMGHARHQTTLSCLSSAADNSRCFNCQNAEALGPYLSQLRSLNLDRVSWATDCTVQSMVSLCPQLRCVTVSHNVDVNALVGSVAASCPLLEKISFSYVNVLSFNREGVFEHPLLQPDVGRSLAKGCPRLKSVCFRHYTIDEEGVQAVLHLPEVREADFSDNESLHGLFLVDIPSRWPRLRELTLRDCTEVEDEHVAAFAFLLTQGGCPELNYIDLSCQWAFFNTSFLPVAAREELARTREVPYGVEEDRALAGAVLRWREDQCEVEGFGVDPEDGIDTMELVQESDVECVLDKERDFKRELEASSDVLDSSSTAMIL